MEQPYKRYFFTFCVLCSLSMELEYFPTVSRYMVGFLKKLFWWEGVALCSLWDVRSPAKEQT